MPATADEDLLAFRRSPRYRAAIWVMRLFNVFILGYLLWTAVAAVGDRPEPPFLLVVAGFVAFMVSTGLFYWAGIQAHINRSREATGHAMLRDTFAPRP
jgi:hypothetical protein